MLATLLVIVCFGPLIAILMLLWLGLGLENGKALVASLLAIAVFAFSTEIVRRRFRISLRAFFVVFTVIGLALGMFGQWLYQARQQKALITRIQQLGGRVHYDYEDTTTGWLQTKNGMLIPAWLRSVFGDSPFADVYMLDLSRSQCQDADLAQFIDAHLKSLSSLKSLHIEKTPITDEGLVHLRTLSNVQHITFFRTGVTAEGIASLKEKLPNCDIRN